MILKAWFLETFVKQVMAPYPWIDLHSIFEIETFDEEKRSNGYSQIVNGLEYNLAPEDYDARSPNSVSNRPIV